MTAESALPRYDVVPLFGPLHEALVALLGGLSAAQWEAPTRAGAWRVRDVAAHLLDGELRELAVRRDGVWGEAPAGALDTHEALLAFLGRLNADWVRAMRRVSPRVLTELLAWSGPQVTALYAALDPWAPAPFGVSWAGEATSATWAELGRQYTERWHHQQQIREAVGAPGLTERRWLRPVLDVSMRALPYGYRDVAAEPGTSVAIVVRGEAGGRWTLVREPHGWVLGEGAAAPSATQPVAALTLDADTAWRLFFRQMTPEEGARRVLVVGDRRLAAPYLHTLAVVA
jgi:uncharacterized protein (TIGR03083 family)